MLLVKPTLTCNQACVYCYENKFRIDHPQKLEYDLPKLLDRISAYQGSITLHGGEPLSIPKADINTLLKAIFDKTGRSAVQTNGTLIDDDFIEMFKKYKTSVGISIDGSGILNEYRTAIDKTEKIVDTIFKLKSSGVGTSVIIVVSKANAAIDRLPDLKLFIKQLSDQKIFGRINPYTDIGIHDFGLSESRINDVYSELLIYTITNGWKWSPFYDMWNSLMGKDSVVCNFKTCDIYHTPACDELIGSGEITNCMRLSDRDMYIKHPTMLNTRNEILSQVDKNDGGCKDCKFWNYCHGGCPSQAIDNDWRNKTNLCSLYYNLFTTISNMQTSFSVISETKNTCRTKHTDSNHTDTGTKGKSIGNK
jgi:uncharacterized protein